MLHISLFKISLYINLFSCFYICITLYWEIYMSYSYYWKSNTCPWLFIVIYFSLCIFMWYVCLYDEMAQLSHMLNLSSYTIYDIQYIWNKNDTQHILWYDNNVDKNKIKLIEEYLHDTEKYKLQENYQVSHLEQWKHS